jgi:sulfite reductase alpha subunit-like flavoprotein
MMIDANARRIYELLDSHDGHMYVCGDFSMANDVKSVVVSIFQEYGNINADEAASAVENLIVSFSIR